MPSLAGIDAQGVLVLRTLADGMALKERLASLSPRRVAIVGAGAVGLEMCEALQALGLEVTLVEMAGQVMPQLAPELAAGVSEHLASMGVSLHTATRVLEISSAGGRVTGLITDSGEIPAEVVLLSIGIRPEVSLAQEAGLPLGAGGAIRVDEHMRTGREDIFAAGDCTATTHRVSGEEVWMPLGSVSRKQGRVAGSNAASLAEVFPGVLGTFILKCFDLVIGGTGLGEEAALRAGFAPVVSTIEGRTIPTYYPGGGSMRARLVADGKSGRLLGAQVVGELAAAVDKRLDIFSVAIQAELTAHDLEALDLAYAPPFSDAVDLPITAGSLLLHEMEDRPPR